MENLRIHTSFSYYVIPHIKPVYSCGKKLKFYLSAYVNYNLNKIINNPNTVYGAVSKTKCLKVYPCHPMNV